MPTRIDFNNKNQLNNILKKADTIEGHELLIKKIKQLMENLVQLWKVVLWQMMDLQKNN